MDEINVTTNLSDYLYVNFEPNAPVIQAILITLLSLATVVTNLILIIAVARTTFLHTKTNVLLVSVAISEVITGLFVMPLTAMLLYIPVLRYITSLCDTIGFMTSLSRSSKSLSMLSVSIDRCIAISYPLQYSSFMSKTSIAFTVTTLWIISFVFAIFPLSNLGKYGFINVHGRCLIDFYLSPVFAIVKEVVCAIIPSFLIFISLIVIIIEARSHHRVTMIAQLAIAMYSGPATKTPGINYARSTLRAMRTYLIITCIYLCTCLPQSVYIIIVAGRRKQSDSIFTILSFLTYICSISTPVVIMTLNIKFRESIMTILSRTNKIQPINDHEPYTISTGLHSILESSIGFKCVTSNERIRPLRMDFTSFDINLPGPSRLEPSVRFIPRKVSVLHEVQSSSSSELSMTFKSKPAVLRKTLSSPC
ncbi:hypothetical protein ACF0H5_023544 [Mactra antiquata]